MVNITDTFTKMYGRPPSQTELGAMMKLQAEQSILRRLKNHQPVQTYKPAGKVGRPKTAKPKRPNPRPSKLTRSINKLMLYLLTDDQIVDALGITRKEFDAQVKKYTLPNLKLDGGQPKFK